MRIQIQSSGLWRYKVAGMGENGIDRGPEDGGSMVLRNVGILTQHYTASSPRRPRHETSKSWKSQNLHCEHV